jgi:hypothetical protein
MTALKVVGALLVIALFAYLKYSQMRKIEEGRERHSGVQGLFSDKK